MDEMRGVCDGLLMSTVLSGITGGITFMRIKIYLSLWLEALISRTELGFQLLIIFTELAPKGVPYLDTYIINILSIAVELLDEAYRYNRQYT